MITRLVKRFSSDLPSAVQTCPPAALSDTEIDQTLRSIRFIEGTLAALKVKLAGARAARRGHGDGGASTLKELGGMSARQARQSVATAKTLGQMQAVQGAIEDGYISADNAARLARAARNTSPQAVESDSGLLAAAQRCASDDFDKTASRWEQARQRDGGMGRHLANRRKRYLRFWTHHGMVHFKGCTDLISGTAIRRRLEQLAQQLRKQDAKTDLTPGNGTGPQPGRLTFAQAMVDALDTATGPDLTNASMADPDSADPDSANPDSADPDHVSASNAKPNRNPEADTEPKPNFALRTGQSSTSNTSRKSRSDSQDSASDTNRTSVNDQNSPTGRESKNDQNPTSSTNRTSVNDQNSPTGRESKNDQNPTSSTHHKNRINDQNSASGTNRRSVSSQNSASGRGSKGDQSSASSTNTRSGVDGQVATGGARREGKLGGQRLDSGVFRWSGGGSGSGMPKAEIVVVMDLLALLGDDNARCEIPAIGPIPAAIARQLAAVNGIVPILLDGDGEPLRHGGQKRLATRAQWQALIARDGTCIGCGADPLRCEAHHDPPFSQTGRTWIEELTLLCYECHHKVHDQKWQIVLKNGRRALQPPDNSPTPNPRNQTEATDRRRSVSVSTPETYQPPMLC